MTAVPSLRMNQRFGWRFWIFE